MCNFRMNSLLEGKIFKEGQHQNMGQNWNTNGKLKYLSDHVKFPAFSNYSHIREYP